MSKTKEEWAALYESGEGEYYEALYDEAQAELSQLREVLSVELEGIKRHIAVTPKDSLWWAWSHGVKDALEALLDGMTTATMEE